MAIVIHEVQGEVMPERSSAPQIERMTPPPKPSPEREFEEQRRLQTRLESRQRRLRAD